MDFHRLPTQEILAHLEPCPCRRPAVFPGATWAIEHGCSVCGHAGEYAIVGCPQPEAHRAALVALGVMEEA